MKRPTVEYNDRTYTVRSSKTTIPDFNQMTRMNILVWLNQNTYATGRGLRTRPNPLAGLGGIINVEVRS